MDEGTTVNASQVYGSHLGPHNNIGPFTHVRVNTVTDYGVHLGAYVETKNSNFARGNTVSHLTYIGDSDVGKYCNFGCGTVTCNYDGKDKFRTQIGDYCFIGCNTNLVAPVKVGDGAYTAAGSTITKDVPARRWASPATARPTLRAGPPQDGGLYRQKAEAGGGAEQVTLPLPYKVLYKKHRPTLFRVQGGAFDCFLSEFMVYCGQCWKQQEKRRCLQCRWSCSHSRPFEVLRTRNSTPGNGLF